MALIIFLHSAVLLQWSNSYRIENHTGLTHQPTGPSWLSTNRGRCSTKQPDYHLTVGCFFTIWTALMELQPLKSLRIPRSVSLPNAYFLALFFLPSKILLPLHIFVLSYISLNEVSRPLVWSKEEGKLLSLTKCYLVSARCLKVT